MPVQQPLLPQQYPSPSFGYSEVVGPQFNQRNSMQPGPSVYPQPNPIPFIAFAQNEAAWQQQQQHFFMLQQLKI
jgi:hypothetical protein